MSVDYRAMTRQAAQAAGIDPERFVRQINQESGYREDVILCQTDSSAGARGIAQIVEKFHPGVNVCSPADALNYAAGLMKNYLDVYHGDWALALSSYNAGSGATARGLAGQLDGWPYAETVTYVAVILGISAGEASARLTGKPTTDRVYGPDVPDVVTLQRNSWSCAVRSLYVALYELAEKELIPPVTYGDSGPRDVYDWMVPVYDDSSVGLHDHTGAGIVAVLKAHGIAASNAYPVALADVQARAGLQPCLLGGDAWQHWVAVRGLEADGTLILENPSPGWMGVKNELRDSFGRLGPMAMVWLDVAPAPPAPADDPALTIAALRGRVAALTAERDQLTVAVAYLADTVGDGHKALVKEAQRVRAEHIGPRPA
jgi:hypothetical protein